MNMETREFQRLVKSRRGLEAAQRASRGLPAVSLPRSMRAGLTGKAAQSLGTYATALIIERCEAPDELSRELLDFALSLVEARLHSEQNEGKPL